MRFSFWPQPTQTFDVVKTLSNHVESSGWDGLWLADHFMPDNADTSAPWPEAWTTLAAIAAVVPRIRIGTLVAGNTYRHPAVLAKMAATVDHISGGRLVLGLGSGWQKNEHEKYGIPFYSVNARLQRLAEACEVITRLFTESSVNFAGEFYQLTDAPLEPKPLQSPLPLLIGGGGEKVTLKIAAQYANEWNVWGNVDTLKHKMNVLDQHCADLKRDPASIQRSAVSLMFLSDDPAFVKQMSTNPAIATMAGNVAQLQEIVAAYKDAGVDELIVPDFTMGVGATEQKLSILDTFINEVAPAGR